LTLTAKQRAAIDTWVGTAASLNGDFFRSVERRWMDPEDVLSGEGTAASGGRFAAPGTLAVYLSTSDTGASKETTARKARLGGTAQISTAKYPRIVFAVAVALNRVLRLDALGSSTPGKAIMSGCLDKNDLSPSMEVATHLVKAGIQGLIFPSVVEGGDDNLVVYIANCSPVSLEIHNKKEFLEEARKIAKKRL
jgi:RES domain-containing protein